MAEINRQEFRIIFLFDPVIYYLRGIYAYPIHIGYVTLIVKNVNMRGKNGYYKPVDRRMV